jgi:hypothetical protein
MLLPAASRQSPLQIVGFKVSFIALGDGTLYALLSRDRAVLQNGAGGGDVGSQPTRSSVLGTMQDGGK